MELLPPEWWDFLSCLSWLTIPGGTLAPEALVRCSTVMVTWPVFTFGYLASLHFWLLGQFTLKVTWLVYSYGYLTSLHFWLHGQFTLLVTWPVTISGYMASVHFWFLIQATLLVP